MATRSTIALEYADGTVHQVYCHWDGYLEHNGMILEKYYKDPFKLQRLIDLGDLSTLGADIGEQHDFNARTEYDENNIGRQCTFYGRDRGEQGTEARQFKDYADYRARAQSEEFNYILRNVDGKATWFVEFYGEFDGPLVEAIEQREAQDA